MQKFLEFIDLFPFNFGLTFKKERTYKTQIGGLLSIIYYIFIGFCAIFFSYDMREKMQPKLDQESGFLSKNILANLTEHNYFAGFYMKNKTSAAILDNKYFETDFYFIHQNETKQKIKPKRCNELNSPNLNYKDIFQGNPIYLKEGVCLDIEENNLKQSQLNISAFLSGFHIRVKCIKQKDGNCVVNSTLNDLFMNDTIHFFYYNTVNDPNNFEDPLKTSLSEYPIYMNVGFTKIINLYYRIVKIDSDKGLLFENFQSYYDLSADNLDSNYRLNSYNKDYTGDIYLILIDNKFTNKSTFIKRTYSKLQDVFAKLAGIMSTLSIIGKIITGFYTFACFNLEMINCIFKLKSLNIKTKLPPVGIKEVINKIPQKSNNNFNKINIKNYNKYNKGSNYYSSNISSNNSRKRILNSNNSKFKENEYFFDSNTINFNKTSKMNDYSQTQNNKNHFKETNINNYGNPSDINNKEINKNHEIIKFNEITQNISLSNNFNAKHLLEPQSNLDLDKTDRKLNEIEKSKIDGTNINNGNKKYKRNFIKEIAIMNIDINHVSKSKPQTLNDKKDGFSKIENKIKQFNKRHRKDYNFLIINFWEILQEKICFTSCLNKNFKKNKMNYQLYLNELSEYMEINRTLEMQSQLLILKHLILNSNQIQATDYLECMLLHRFENENKNEAEANKLESLKNVYEFYSIAKREKETGNINEIDERILNSLNQELKEIFDV